MKNTLMGFGKNNTQKIKICELNETKRIFKNIIYSMFSKVRIIIMMGIFF